MMLKFYLLYLIPCICWISIWFILMVLIYNSWGNIIIVFKNGPSKICGRKLLKNFDPFVVKSLEIILKIYTLPAISGKTKMPSRQMSEQLIPPDSAGISWLLMFRIVYIKYVVLCLNPVIKHKYAACGSYQAILHNIHGSVIHRSTFSLMQFCELFGVSMTAPRCLLLFVVIFISMCLKVDSARSPTFFWSLTSIYFVQKNKQILDKSA